MRIPLQPTSDFTDALSLPKPSNSDPPIAFINDEPFIIELQGSLEMPGGGRDGDLGGMDGVVVGKLNLDEPHKPILQIAHHRLEGKLVTLAEPYALLRTTPSHQHTSPEDSEANPTPKRRRLHQEDGAPAPTSSPEKAMVVKEELPPKIEIVGLVRRKIVFSKRPEPTIILNADEDLEDGKK